MFMTCIRMTNKSGNAGLSGICKCSTQCSGFHSMPPIGLASSESKVHLTSFHISMLAEQKWSKTQCLNDFRQPVSQNARASYSSVSIPKCSKNCSGTWPTYAPPLVSAWLRSFCLNRAYSCLP